MTLKLISRAAAMTLKSAPAVATRRCWKRTLICKGMRPIADRLSLGLPTIPKIPIKKVFRAILGFLRFLRANAKRAIGLSRENPRKLIGTQNGILLSLKVGFTDRT